MPAFLKQKTFLIGTLVAAVVVLAMAAFFVLGQKQERNEGEDDETQVSTSSATTSQEISDVRWENTAEGGWLALSTPPTCPNPFTLQSPSDLTKATSILYPGQERKGEVFGGAGGNYKPHGGFRFDGLALTDVKVVSPISGYVYRGANYLMGGEIQYTFDLIHPCGYMIRLGHLRQLSPKFQTYAAKFPQAAEMDSRTERIEGFPLVTVGEEIATAVGLPPTNTFFDLGVYDLRAQNEISKTSSYQQAHADAKELAYYAVCWFDMLPSRDATKIKSLPAGDPLSGKQSDYCK